MCKCFTILFIALLCETYARNNLSVQNYALSNCLRNLMNIYFTKNDEESYLENIIMTYSSMKHIMLSNSNLSIFYIPEYDRVISAAGAEESFKAEKLLLEMWMKEKSKVEIFQFRRNNFTLATNINMESSKVCTGNFYETYREFCGNLTVTKNFLSKSNSKILCRIRVSWVKAPPYIIDIKRKNNPGLMISILKMYKEKTNVKIIFQKDNKEYQHEFLNHGTFFKLQKDLFEGKYDIGIGPLFMNFTEDVSFSYSPAFFKDYYLLTDKKDQIPSYQKLTVAFDANTWRSFLIIFLLVVSSYILMAFAVEPSELGFSTAIFDVIRLTLNSCTPNVPRSISLRLLLAFYSIFSITLGTAYLGTLSSVLTDVPYRAISEAVDVFKRGFQLNFMGERLIRFKMVVERQYTSFGNEMILVTNESDEDVLKGAAWQKHERFALFLHSALLSNPYEASLIDATRVNDVHLTLFPTVHIRNDFHLKESLQFWVLEMFEKGFISKWWRNIADENGRGRNPVKEKNEAIPLNLKHFGEVFKLCLVGCAVGAFVLILELIYKWLDDRVAVTEKIMFVLKLLIPPPVEG